MYVYLNYNIVFNVYHRCYRQTNLSIYCRCVVLARRCCDTFSFPMRNGDLSHTTIVLYCNTRTSTRHNQDVVTPFHFQCEMEIFLVLLLYCVDNWDVFTLPDATILWYCRWSHQSFGCGISSVLGPRHCNICAPPPPTHTHNVQTQLKGLVLFL